MSSSIAPQPGQVVHLRMRTYLAEGVETNTGHGTLVSLACLDDDAQGQELQVIWELEPDAKVRDAEAWRKIGEQGFDRRDWFGAYWHTLRWGCVTATEPRLFQSPFRAGIRLDAYQLEPLRKALLLPRVNLFIADDVGLGKTIEAGLIASELLLRRRVREVVVVCPPSMLPQWRDEMDARFGLTFEILDREYVNRIRRDHGFGVNPWTTFPRFLVSQHLLIDETYAGPLRAWLGELRPGSLLILDEAHHCAPAAGGARYAIDSKITRAIRGLAPHFEHHLFLSATPHNGHSNSFSALLELLDADRFVRGVPVDQKSLNQVMVRRLKNDIRSLQGGFPERVIDQIDLDGLPADTPELVLAGLLDEYREVHGRRLADGTKRVQAHGALLLSGLQQRLFSSVEAFAKTLAAHRRTMERIWAADAATAATPLDEALLAGSPDADTEHAALPEDDLAQLEAAAFEAATLAAAGSRAAATPEAELVLLDQMQAVAEGARSAPDARVRHLLRWIREHLLTADGAWADQRLLIFTEYEDTRRWLVAQLRADLAATDRAAARIDVYSGATSTQRRRELQRAFNTAPAEHPLRILVATDAAREGLNLQAHCHHLFHLDLPWNPSRLEQRNGRIDRKLQPRARVYCHYFVYAQRPEDRVLEVLVKKTEIIRKELGSLSQVLEERLADLLAKGGIRRSRVDRVAREIDELEPAGRDTVEKELEKTRKRAKDLEDQLDTLRTHLDTSRRRLGLDPEALRDALSCALAMSNIEPLAAAATPEGQPARYVFPNLDARRGTDPGWAGTLETLRARPPESTDDSRQQPIQPLRPVVFRAPEGIDDDVVQLHLSHRVVQRLLSRFSAQGFVHHDLSRACLATTADSIPRLALIGRLSLYGHGAARLHEEILTVTARWTAPSSRSGPLAPLGREAEARTLDQLEAALRPGAVDVPHEVTERLRAALPGDLADLLPHLETRGASAEQAARAKLAERGRREAQDLETLLDAQQRRVRAEQANQAQLPGVLSDDEARQLAADRRAWDRWLAGFAKQREEEPRRIARFYEVTARRLEPVGLVYLWPVTG